MLGQELLTVGKKPEYNINKIYRNIKPSHVCKTKTRKNMSNQNSRKYFGYYREIQVWWKLHHKEDNWRTRSVVEKRM